MFNANMYAKLGILKDAVETLNEVCSSAYKQKDIAKITSKSYNVKFNYEFSSFNAEKSLCDISMKIELTPKLNDFFVKKIDIELYKVEVPVLAKHNERYVIASIDCIDAVYIDMFMAGSDNPLKLKFFRGDWDMNEWNGQTGISYATFDNGWTYETYKAILKDLDEICNDDCAILESFMQYIGRIDAGKFNDDNTAIQYEYYSVKNNGRTFKNLDERTKIFESYLTENGQWTVDDKCELLNDLSEIVGNEVAEEAFRNMIARLVDQDTTHFIFVTR